MMSMSPDPLGGGVSEPMSMGTPTSPGGASPAGTGYLPCYLLGDATAHTISPVSSRLWSGSGGSPPRSSQRHTSLTSPVNTNTATPRFDVSLRGKEKAGAPPVRSLLHSSSPGQSFSSPYSTPTQYVSRAGGLTSPAPPTTGLSHSLHDTVYATPDQTAMTSSRVQTLSPAQVDPFYTQGESLVCDDVLDETWITVFGFPPPAAAYVLQQFAQYGNILKHVIASEGNWMHIHYQSKLQAKKALSKNGKILGDNIMVGVSACIDKKVMECEKENDPLSGYGSAGNQSGCAGQSTPARHTPIRPLTAAYMAARSEHEVIQSSQAPKKNSGFVGKAMEYMFGW